MPPIVWPVLWILLMVGMIVATTVAGLREKKSRIRAAGAQPMQMDQDAMIPSAEGGDGFGDSFEPSDAGFGDDPFK